MSSRKMLFPALLLLAVLLSGCLEQLSTTRLPSGSARNFFLYLTRAQVNEADAYWAPDFTPGDAEQQVRQAIAALDPYEFELARQTPTEMVSDTAMSALVRGRLRPKGTTEWSEEQDLMSAELIERGPGWRLTSFAILCCDAAPAAETTATPMTMP